MDDVTLSETTVTAVIRVPIERVNLPEWLFNLPDAEYQRCSPAHIACGTTRTDDGRPMSINVEMIGGSIVVQHYVADVAEPHQLRLISQSDTFSPNGPAKVQVMWELTVRRIDAESCELANHIHGTSTDDFHAFLDRHGLPFGPAAAARQAASDAHNRIETPLFAKSIERHARAAQS